MRKKLIKILRIKVAVLGIFFVLILLALQTTWVKQIITSKLKEQLSEITQSSVIVKRSEGILPVSFDFYDLSFEKDHKTWLTIERLSFNRSLLFWFFWKKKQLDLTLHKANLHFIPNVELNNSETSFQWPKLPYSSLSIKVDGDKINIDKKVFDQQIPQNLSANINFSFSRYGQVIFLKGKLRSDELKHAKLKASFRGHQKQNIVHANIEIEDPHHELGPYYIKNSFPAFNAKLNLSGGPEAFVAFFQPNRQTTQTFRGTFSAAAYPSVSDNDILSCLINKKELKIDSEMSFTNDEGLTLTHLDLKGAEMLFNGQISLSRNYQFQRSYLEGEILCLNFTKHWIEKPLEGEIRGIFHLLGDYHSPTVYGEIASDSLAYKHFVAYHFLSNFKYVHKGKNHVGELSLKANLNQSPFEFSSKYEMQNLNHFDLEDVLMRYGANELTTPYLKKRNEIYQSTLDFNFEKIALFSSFLKHEVHGDMRGKAILDISVTPKGTLQIVDSTFNGTYFQIPKVNWSDYYIRISGSFPWKEWKKFHGELEGTCGLIQYKQFSFESLQAYLNKKDQSALYKLQAEGTIDVLSAGEVFSQDQGWAINLRELSGHLQDHAFHLMNKSKIQFSKKELSFNPILMKIGEGQLYLAKDPTKDQATLNVKRFPISTFSAFYPQFEAKGFLNLEANLHNLSKKTYGNIQAQFSQLRAEERSLKDVYSGQINATLDKKFLKGSINLNENKKTLMTLLFDLPLSLSLYPWEFDFSSDRNSKIDLTYNGWINPFIQMAIPHNHLLEGYANVNLKLKGFIKEPEINGFCFIHKGYYENLFLGLVLKDIEMQTESKGHTLYLKSFVANDGLKGSVTAHGKMTMSLRKKFPYQLDFNLNNGQIIQFDFLSASFLGDLSLKGNFKKSYLTGDVKITEAEVNIPSNIGKKLPILPVTYLYPRDEAPCLNKSNDEKLFPIYFDLNLDVLNKTVIKGRGLDSSWAGKLYITGSDLQPKFKGTLRSQEGTFEFAGRYFELREGTLNFNGRLGKDTSLNLTASHEIMNHLISANLKGPLLAPYLSFKSEPAESKRDIISLVLFGQKVDSLNTFQGISLTFTLASLSGVYEGPSVVDKIRKGVGLDQLSLGSFMDNDKDYTTIQVGKYITRGILITLSRPIATDPSPFIITAHFRKGFQFQTYFDEQQISKLMIQWRLSY